MRNLQLAFALFMSPLCVDGQIMSQSETSQPTAAVAVSAATYKKGANETPEQARLQVMTSLNLYRGYSVVVDDPKSGENTETEDNTTPEDRSNFKGYITKMELVLQRRLKALESDNIKDSEQLAEKSELIRAFNILKSASCLSERKEGNFVRQKDLDGQDIIAFRLDDLRSNARYGLVDSYREGMARIKKDQVFGFLNYCGDEIIPCQYETADNFNNGRALVKKVDWYFIDSKGQESDVLVNVTDAKAMSYGITLAHFKNGKYAFIDNRYDVTKAPISGYYDEIIPFFGKDIFRVKEGNKYGLITLQGVTKLETNYENIDLSSASHLYKITQNGKIGLVDTFWKVKFNPEFDFIGEFNNKGLAICKVGDSYRLIHNRTYKNSNLYKNISSFGKEGLAQIQDATGNFGLINADLQVVVDPMYFSIGTFNDLGMAPACRYDKKCGYINTKGTEIITPVYEEVEAFNPHGLVVVRELTKDCNKNKNCKTDIVYNKYGQVIIAKANEKEVTTMKIRYELMDTLHSDKYVAVKMYIDEEIQGFHLIEAKSYKLMTTTPYHSITPFDVNGMLRVKKNNLWGLLDTAGKVILPPTYLEIRKPGEGFYPVKNDNEKIGFIDKKAKIQIPFEYDDVKTFRNGHCIVTKGKEKWGLINKFNAKIVPLYFKGVFVKDGQYEMTDDKGGVYMIDDKGDCVQNCQKFEELRRKANQ